MHCILRQEWYAIRHSWPIKWFFGFALIAAILGAAPSLASLAASGTTGSDAFLRALTDSPYAALMGSVLAGLYFGTDFRQKTIRLPIAAGASRISVFASRAIVFFLLAIPAVLLYPICRGLTATAVNGWGSLSLAQLLGMTAIGLWMYILIFAVFLFISFAVRDAGKTIGISLLGYICYSMLYTMVAPDLFLFAEVSPAVVFDRLAGGTLSAAAVGLLAITGLTYAKFRKSDV